MAIGITTRFLQVTNFKGARIKARTDNGKTLTVGRAKYDHLDNGGLHRAVALELAARVFDTTPDMVGLGEGVFCNLPGCEWAFRAWVKG